MNEKPGGAKEKEPGSSFRWGVERIIGLLAAGGGIVALANFLHLAGGSTATASVPTPSNTVASVPTPHAPRKDLVPLPDQSRACAKLPVAKSPNKGRADWPVHRRPELATLVCHVAEDEEVNLVCRQGRNAVCVEGPDSETSSRCVGYVHSDAFVSRGALPKELSQLPKCDEKCLPLNSCTVAGAVAGM
jgi:hypothetical protein